MKNLTIIIIIATLFGCGYPSQRKMQEIYQARVDSLNEVRKWQKSDDDGDGVINLFDSCASTPPKARVNANGCPMDVDADGVIDVYDNCVTKPGPRSNHGCPEDDKEDE